MPPSKILITGGAGFIGSHVADALLKREADVVVLDNFSSGSPDNLASLQGRLKVMTGDITNRSDAESACSGVETVIHLAAQPSVPVSIQSPIETHQVNYTGTLMMLDAARRAGVKRFLYASSAAVYSKTTVPPVRETERPAPASPYGVDKLAGEFILEAYQGLYGIETLSLRFFNIYGERQDPTSPYSGVISIFVERIRRGEALHIYGDGQQSRDFVYVGDVANLVSRFSAEVPGGVGVMNLGTGKPTTLLELVNVLEAVVGKKANLVFHEPRAGDLFASYAANETLLNTGEFAWTSLDRGLTSLVRSLG
jgi:UDP-glucose 4-epimerase